MKKIILVILFFIGLYGAIEFHQTLAVLTVPPFPPRDPQRIISLAPSVTETLYALGLGDKVVGVTQFCYYPPEVLKKPQVAGFSNVNLEAVVWQRPDLVILPVDKISNRQNLERLGLSVLPLDTRSLSGLMAAVRMLGETAGRQVQAQAIGDRLAEAIRVARNRAKGRLRPTVLFSIMHNYEGPGYIAEINIVGRDGFFSELIDIAGGRNVYQGPLAFPRLSREAIIYLNPEVIVDVIIGAEDVETVRRDWQSLASVEAIKNGRLFFLTDKSDTVPGPRIHKTLIQLAQYFHSEVNKGSETEKNHAKD